MNQPSALMRWRNAFAAAGTGQRCLLAFSFGFASALAFAPVNLFPLLWVGFPALITLVASTPSSRAAFAVGWSFAFGYFLLGLYWIAAAMFVDIGAFWWAVPLAVAGLPAFFALYYGAASAVARRIGVEGISGALVFALLWFVADYVRGHLFTGFPWNFEAHVWGDVLPLLQSVSIFGVYGLTLLTLVAACLPAACKGAHRARAHAALWGVGLVFVALIMWGAMRLPVSGSAETETVVRIVQPNVNQLDKWTENGREERFQQLLELTATPAKQPVSFVVWPETASTFYLAEDAAHRSTMAAVLPSNAVVLTGVVRRYLDDDGQLHYANALVAIDRSGAVVDAYDKVHLVPFGEYIPLRRWLGWRTLANLGVDFTAGPEHKTMRLGALPSFSPLICYEAIFPGEVARRDDRPQFLLNVTNDGWYGRTAGPYQHYVVTHLRAIEEGLPLVRAANTGISAVMDGYGRTVADLALGQKGVVDAALPAALPPTLFVRYGEIPLWVMVGVLVTSAVMLRRFKL